MGVTAPLKSKELIDFFTSTANACFRTLELDRRMDKCDFSMTFFICLTERANANCDDVTLKF